MRKERDARGAHLVPAWCLHLSSIHLIHPSPLSLSLLHHSNLMARQDLADLGIGPDGAVDGSGGGAPQPPQASAAATQRSPPETPNTARRASGFLAGVRPSSSTGAS